MRRPLRAKSIARTMGNLHLRCKEILKLYDDGRPFHKPQPT